MKLPNGDRAVVPKGKITAYLLSATHRDGRSKAAFFMRFGFDVDRWEELAAALKDHALRSEVRNVEASSFGTRYVMDGPVQSPDGRAPEIRTVWFIETGEDVPRLATAHPLPRRKP